jgi:antitoxin MazE
MKTKIVPLGNSQGVRIPKLLLEQAAMPEDVELEVVGNTIVIRPARKPREGWAEDIAAKGVDPLDKEDRLWLETGLTDGLEDDDSEWWKQLLTPAEVKEVERKLSQIKGKVSVEKI